MQFSLFVCLEGNSLCNHCMQRALFTAVANKKSSFITVKTKRTTEKLGSKVYSKPPISVIFTFQVFQRPVPHHVIPHDWCYLLALQVFENGFHVMHKQFRFILCIFKTDRACLEIPHLIEKKDQYENAAVLILVMKSFLC